MAGPLADDPATATSAVTLVEVRRNLTRLLTPDDVAATSLEFERDWLLLDVIRVDDAVCRRAAEISDRTLARTLDAIHLCSAERIGAPLLTFDMRQAAAARAIGVPVVEV